MKDDIYVQYYQARKEYEELLTKLFSKSGLMLMIYIGTSILAAQYGRPEEFLMSIVFSAGVFMYVNPEIQKLISVGKEKKKIIEEIENC